MSLGSRCTTSSSFDAIRDGRAAVRNGDGVLSPYTPGEGIRCPDACGILMGTASQPSSSDRFSVVELTVGTAQGDLLEVDPLDFGPDAPATAALEAERGPEPRDVRQRGE